MTHTGKPFNLWRNRPYEPPIRGYLRGTTALVALILLILFAVFIVSEAADRNQTYALRTYRHTESPPQPNLFTNHCTSALTEGGNLDEFAQLVRARTECRSIAGSIGYYVSVDCTPAWYNVTKAFIRDANRFRSYYATPDTVLCLGLECPNCAERPTNGGQPAFGWDQVSVALNWPTTTGNDTIWRKDQTQWVGQTAIWLWSASPNTENGKDRRLPFNTADPPFTSKNETHHVIELSYEESGEANSNGFADFVGWKIGLWKQGHYSASLVAGNRVSPFDASAHSTIIFNQKPWSGWLESQQYSVTTLPGIVGTLGGLWSVFNGIFILIFGTSFAYLLFGSKLISLNSKLTIQRQVASARLDTMYLTSGKPIDEEERLRALTAYMADFIVDTGELDLTVGRIPGGVQEAPEPVTESEGDVVNMALKTSEGKSESESKALTES